MGTANGKMMEFALLAGNRFGFLVNHIGKLAANISFNIACDKPYEQNCSVCEESGVDVFHGKSCVEGDGEVNAVR